MAVSRAAVLQSLVVDDSFRQYQSSAINTVQNLSSVFTEIAHVLQKQKADASHTEHTLQKQVNALIMTINEQASVIEDLKSTQDSWAERFALLTKGDPEKSKYSIGSRLARIEQYLSLADDPDIMDDYMAMTGMGDQQQQQQQQQHQDEYGNDTTSSISRPTTQQRSAAAADAGEDTDGSGALGSGQEQSLSLPPVGRGASQQQQTGQTDGGPQQQRQHLPVPGAGAGDTSSGNGSSARLRSHPVAASDTPYAPRLSAQGLSQTSSTGPAAGSSSAASASAGAGASAGTGSASGHPVSSSGLNLSSDSSSQLHQHQAHHHQSGPRGQGRPQEHQQQQQQPPQHQHHHHHHQSALPARALPLPSRLMALETKLGQIESFLGARGEHQYENRLELILSEKEPSALARKEQVERRLQTQENALNDQRNSLGAARDDLSRVQEQVEMLQQKLSLHAEHAHERSTALQGDVDGLRGALEQRSAEAKEEVVALEEQLRHRTSTLSESVAKLQAVVDGKADVRLVLDKVNKQEWLASVRRLQQSTEDLATRSLGKHEYKRHMEQLRDTMVEDQTSRERNIAKLANELQRVVQDVSAKASKADLVDVANVLATFPQVHRELDHLKMFVDQEIASKHDLHVLQEALVSQKQLRRNTERLLQAIGEELRADPVNAGGQAVWAGLGGQAPLSVTSVHVSSVGVCDTCSRKTQLSGRTCALCVSTLAGKGVVTRGDSSNAPGAPITKGGGFTLTHPRRNEKLYVPGTVGIARGKTAQSQAAGASTVEPPSVAPPDAGETRAPQSKSRTTGWLPSAPARVRGAVVDPVEETAAGRKEVLGTDGRRYASTGARSHTMIIRKDKKLQ